MNVFNHLPFQVIQARATVLNNSGFRSKGVNYLYSLFPSNFPFRQVLFTEDVFHHWKIRGLNKTHLFRFLRLDVFYPTLNFFLISFLLKVVLIKQWSPHAQMIIFWN